MSDTDPRLRVAGLTSEDLARREEEMATTFKRLHDALDRIGPKDDWDAHDMTMEQFAKLVRAQQEMAKQLLDGYAPFKAAMERYRKDLERAPGAYRQAAGYYRERAEQETDALLKKNYDGLAESCDIYAAIVHERHKELDRFLREVEEALPFVEKTAVFLKDFEDFTRLTPGLDDAPQRRAYRARLKEFLKTFDKFQDAFELFTQKLKERSLSSKLRQEHEQALALAQAQEVTRRAQEEQDRQRDQYWAEFERRRQMFQARQGQAPRQAIGEQIATAPRGAALPLSSGPGGQKATSAPPAFRGPPTVPQARVAVVPPRQVVQPPAYYQGPPPVPHPAAAGPWRTVTTWTVTRPMP